METSGSDAAVTYLGKAEERDGYYDLEHLPPLLEDEVRQRVYMNVGINVVIHLFIKGKSV